ncbi:hypothetical protein ACF073_20600 [Streptomyces sp. NPDC015171]|uniref:hypothetical protein n=1 Tax=Streptomyces sp. NPDC015171 TaxID=3364945 RepID=UPI0036F63C51
MNTPSRPRLKSLTLTPTGQPVAEQAAPEPAEGESTGAARKGVVTALRPDPRQDDGRYPIAWLHIRAPRGTRPTATSQCECGWDRSAVGKRKVIALIEAHTAHRNACPLRHPQEERAAA